MVFASFDADDTILTLLLSHLNRALLVSSLDLGETGEINFSEFESVFGSAA